ncbi:hypothetical protein BU16DRAFT_532491 [Lophium mytilinum]|uniref:Uncharacterized protein n=1 Tax=Lophium mytilinum TaxID=390894 RepID=A0A6A6RCA9_9PEZI|nr:hypothetical protein BU16DRAFT_532491 [Lophium mytilinum]
MTDSTELCLLASSTGFFLHPADSTRLSNAGEEIAGATVFCRAILKPDSSATTPPATSFTLRSFRAPSRAPHPTTARPLASALRSPSTRNRRWSKSRAASERSLSAAPMKRTSSSRSSSAERSPMSSSESKPSPLPRLFDRFIPRAPIGPDSAAAADISNSYRNTARPGLTRSEVYLDRRPIATGLRRQEELRNPAVNATPLRPPHEDQYHHRLSDQMNRLRQRSRHSRACKEWVAACQRAPMRASLSDDQRKPPPRTQGEHWYHRKHLNAYHGVVEEAPAVSLAKNGPLLIKGCRLIKGSPTAQNRRRELHHAIATAKFLSARLAQTAPGKVYRNEDLQYVPKDATGTRRSVLILGVPRQVRLYQLLRLATTGELISTRLAKTGIIAGFEIAYLVFAKEAAAVEIAQNGPLVIESCPSSRAAVSPELQDGVETKGWTRCVRIAEAAADIEPADLEHHLRVPTGEWQMDPALRYWNSGGDPTADDQDGDVDEYGVSGNETGEEDHMVAGGRCLGAGA